MNIMKNIALTIKKKSANNAGVKKGITKTYMLLLCMLLLAGFTKTSAQTNNDDLRSMLGIGIRAGVNLANIYDVDAGDLEHKTRIGLAVGAFLNLPFGQYVGFQPELIYSQKGYRSSGSILDASYKFSRRIDYLDIPLQLQIKPAPVLTLLLGPQYSFLLSKNLKVNSGSLGADITNEIDNQNIRKNILGLVFGADLNFQNLILGGKISWDLQRNNGDGTSSSPRYRNVVGQITLGLYF
jgi:hypothetical protein